MPWGSGRRSWGSDTQELVPLTEMQQIRQRGQQGTDREGLISQTKESELHPADQEQDGRDLSRGGAESNLWFTKNTMEAKGKVGWSRARL